jgi:magnesium transporter
MWKRPSARRAQKKRATSISKVVTGSRLAPRPHPQGQAFFAQLYGNDAAPRQVSAAQLKSLHLADDTLLWIDLDTPSKEVSDQVWDACNVPQRAREFLEHGTTPCVGQDDAVFWVRGIVVSQDQQAPLVGGAVLWCIAGPNYVISIRRQPIGFLDALRHEEHSHVPIGRLSAESFVAILLDRQLASYFDAVSDYELAVERLEVDILGGSATGSLLELQRLRRWASRLRRMLAPHRAVFGALSRPDFRPHGGKEADRHFVALDTRFERAMDMVENARELVIGSFELFSNQTALKTNESMKVLTFVTVVTGLLATLVGALGMNFQASFFSSNDVGFWVAVAGLGVLAVTALILGRRRRWY